MEAFVASAASEVLVQPDHMDSLMGAAIGAAASEVLVHPLHIDSLIGAAASVVFAQPDHMDCFVASAASELCLKKFDDDSDMFKVAFLVSSAADCDICDVDSTMAFDLASIFSFENVAYIFSFENTLPSEDMPIVRLPK